jgi:ribosomal protein S2
LIRELEDTELNMKFSKKKKLSLREDRMKLHRKKHGIDMKNILMIGLVVNILTNIIVNLMPKFSSSRR